MSAGIIGSDTLTDEDLSAIDARASDAPKCDDCDLWGSARKHHPSVCPKGWGIAGRGAMADARALLRNLREARSALATLTIGLVATEAERDEMRAARDRLIAENDRLKSLCERQRKANGAVLAENDRLRALVGDGGKVRP